MENKLPPGLNENLLSLALQGGKDNKQVTIVSFTAKPAVAVGDNYCSNLWRIQVEYKTTESSGLQSESLIIKILIEEGFHADVLEMLPEGAMYSEPKIYKHILPKMYEKIKYEFGPKSFYCPLRGGLVLKDLKSEGYVMCDRFEQLDFHHCKMVLETLAKYHGTSVACHHDNSELIEDIGKERVYIEEGAFIEISKVWITAAAKYSAELLSQMDGQQSSTDFIYKRADQIWESVVKICKPKTTGLNVLNHGDCWTNNMMFKHDESGKVVDVKLIDFQIPRYVSPILDLTYFLWTSANEEVRENKIEELFKIYLHILNKTLEELGCEERLSFEELLEDFKLSTNWCLFAICFVLPFCTCEPEDAMDTKALDPEFFKNLPNDPRFQKMYRGKRLRAFLASSVRQLETCTL